METGLYRIVITKSQLDLQLLYEIGELKNLLFDICQIDL